MWLLLLWYSYCWQFSFFPHIPEIREKDETEVENFHLMYSAYHLKWAVIAQFFYVGAQVCVGSFFIRYSRYVDDIPEKKAANWWSVAM